MDESKVLPACILGYMEAGTHVEVQRVWRTYATPELCAFVALAPEALGTAMVALAFLKHAIRTEMTTRRCVRKPDARTFAVADAARERIRRDEISGNRAA